MSIDHILCDRLPRSPDTLEPTTTTTTSHMTKRVGYYIIGHWDTLIFGAGLALTSIGGGLSSSLGFDHSVVQPLILAGCASMGFALAVIASTATNRTTSRPLERELTSIGSTSSTRESELINHNEPPDSWREWYEDSTQRVSRYIRANFREKVSMHVGYVKNRGRVFLHYSLFVILSNSAGFYARPIVNTARSIGACTLGFWLYSFGKKFFEPSRLSPPDTAQQPLKDRIYELLRTYPLTVFSTCLGATSLTLLRTMPEAKTTLEDFGYSSLTTLATAYIFRPTGIVLSHLTFRKSTSKTMRALTNVWAIISEYPGLLATVAYALTAPISPIRVQVQSLVPSLLYGLALGQNDFVHNHSESRLEETHYTSLWSHLCQCNLDAVTCRILTYYTGTYISLVAWGVVLTQGIGVTSSPELAGIPTAILAYHVRAQGRGDILQRFIDRTRFDCLIIMQACIHSENLFITFLAAFIGSLFLGGFQGGLNDVEDQELTTGISFKTDLDLITH